MSHILNRLTYFKNRVSDFSNGHGVLTKEDRTWEDAYRKEYEHDVVGYAAHCVNCHGNCAFKILAKDGIVARGPFEIEQGHHRL